MITIDRVTRQMKIPDKEKILGVVSDEDSHTLYFTCASILDQNFDLTTANIYINYRRSDGEIGQYMVTDKSVVKGTCTFSWLVSRAAYTQKGTVDFIVCMKIVDEDGIVQKEWNTTLGHLTVLEGLEPEGEIPIPPADTDLISQLMNQVNTTVDQAEADINSTKTSAIEALDQKVTEVSDAIDDKIADLNTLGVVHPNLLINSDFKSGIINQRGQASYINTGHKVTVDMWRKSSGTVTVGTNSITYTNDGDTDIGLEQVIDVKGPITIYVNATVKTGTAKLALYSSLEYDTDGLEEYNLTTGENIFHVASGTVKILQIKLTQNSSIEIHQVKVEKGSMFTGMPQWDYAIELTKCSRYQKAFALNSITYAQVAGFESQLTYLFEINFYKIPTVDILNDGTKSNVSRDSFHFTQNRMVWDIVANDIGTVLITDKIVVLDANIY